MVAVVGAAGGDVVEDDADEVGVDLAELVHGLVEG